MIGDAGRTIAIADAANARIMSGKMNTSETAGCFTRMSYITWVWTAPPGNQRSRTMPNNPTLRPPPEHAHLPYHWLKSNAGFPFVMLWHSGAWWSCGSEKAWTPQSLSDDRSTYWKPCDPAAITVDPNDAEMVECVARIMAGIHGHDPDSHQSSLGGLNQNPRWHWFIDGARAVLTALATNAKRPA